MKVLNELRVQLFTKYTLIFIDHQGRTINTNIAEVQAKNVFFWHLDNAELLDWNTTHKFASFWYCHDIHHFSILKLVVEKAIHKSPQHLLSSELFDDGSNNQQNQFDGFVSSHTKGNAVLSFHIHSFAVFLTNLISNIIVTCFLTTQNHILSNMQDCLLQLMQ